MMQFVMLDIARSLNLQLTIRKRSYRNFDIDKYLEDVSAIDFRDLYCTLDVDEAAQLLTNKIVEVLNVHAPWIVFQQRTKYVPWVTDETKQLMKERDGYKEHAKSLARLDQNGASSAQTDMWLKYKKVRNRVNNLLKQEEIRFKKQKFKECHGSSDQVWALAKKYMDWASNGPPTRLESEKDGGMTLISKAADIAKLMNEFFVQKVDSIVGGLEEADCNLGGCLSLMQGKRISMSLNHLTVYKVRKLLGTLKTKKSTSVDQLDNFSVKIAADYLARPLHHVISLSIMQQKFPSCWKFTKIIPLHKKNSTLKKENYRPVAILSPLSKVLEKAVYEQIYSYFEKSNLFHSALHGYRGNRSTLTALLTMYEKWVKAASHGQVTGVVLADLSAAFDLVSPTLLIRKLKIYGFRDDILAWLTSYLTGRFQSVWIDHTFSEFIENNIGVPQGSNLGPLLFLIFFNDLAVSFNGDLDCYADDSTISTTGQNVFEVEEKLNSRCLFLSNWMKENKFKLNAEKTHLMVVGTSAKLKNLPQIEVRMNETNLHDNSKEKEILLGVVIQNNLKWSSQIALLCGKLKKRIAVLDRLTLLASEGGGAGPPK